MPSVDARVKSVQLNPETGWATIELETDNGRVPPLQTKRDDKIDEALAVKKSGLVAHIKYSEKASGNINPNTNQPYPPNRYWEEATTLGEKPQEREGLEIVQPQPQTYRRTDPDDARRMALSTGAKLALQEMPMLRVEERTTEIAQRKAFEWACFIYFTELHPLTERSSVFQGSQTAFASRPSGTGRGAYDDPPDYESPPPHGDDDIPF